MRICPECDQRYSDDIEVCPDDQTPTLTADDDVTPEALVGAILDNRWKLKSLLGKGGMGAVYRAEQLSVQREVAVKIILPQIGLDAQMVARFFREAKVMSAMKHPNIVTLFDFGQDTETKVLYLVMELLPGQDLSSLLRQRNNKLTLREILSIGEQLMAALSDAHRHGIIHRDLKPQNLMIEDISGVGFHLTLLDFGIARVDESGEEQLTRTGMLQGTPKYMAPEQIQNGDVTAQTDVYAAGVVLYRLLAAQEPFVGETLFDIMLKQVRENPQPLNEAWRIDDPPNATMITLVHSMLAKDVAQRPKTALDVRDRLLEVRAQVEAAQLMGGAALQHTGALSSPSNPAVAAPHSDPSHPSLPNTGHVSDPSLPSVPTLSGVQQPTNNSNVLYAVIAVVALLGTGIGVFLFISNNTEDPKPTDPTPQTSSAEAPKETPKPPSEDPPPQDPPKEAAKSQTSEAGQTSEAKPDTTPPDPPNETANTKVDTTPTGTQPRKTNPTRRPGNKTPKNTSPTAKTTKPTETKPPPTEPKPTNTKSNKLNNILDKMGKD